MKKYLLLLPVLLMLVLTGCREKKEFPGFDSRAWKNDPKACKDVRSGMQQDVQHIRLQLLGLSEPEIIDVLGRPDAEELHERNQKYYFYYMEKGSQCNIKAQLSEANRLKIRINSLNVVSEATYERPLPGNP